MPLHKKVLTLFCRVSCDVQSLVFVNEKDSVFQICLDKIKIGFSIKLSISSRDFFAHSITGLYSIIGERGRKRVTVCVCVCKGKSKRDS